MQGGTIGDVTIVDIATIANLEERCTGGQSREATDVWPR
jgi:hypothetical protein